MPRNGLGKFAVAALAVLMVACASDDRPRVSESRGM